MEPWDVSPSLQGFRTGTARKQSCQQEQETCGRHDCQPTGTAACRSAFLPPPKPCYLSLLPNAGAKALTHSNLSPTGKELDTSFFGKDAESAPSSSGVDSWGTNPSGRRPALAIYLIQVWAAGVQQAFAMCSSVVSAQNDLCLCRGDHMPGTVSLLQ